jgi:hypothetical protein
MTSVPVIINNFNRYEPFLKLVGWLKSLQGISDIIICDNASKYPPLLDYYSKNPDNLRIIKYDHNGGHMMPKNALRDAGIRQDKVIVTDPDLIPYADTPADTILKLDALMDSHIGINKVGCGLGLHDLPEHYPFMERIRRHELGLLGKVLPDGSREALIDTTFCLYRCPDAFGDWRSPAIRTQQPYILKHVDWYIDPMQLSPEYCWYLDNTSKSASYAEQLKDWYKLRKIDYHTKVVQ